MQKPTRGSASLETLAEVLGVRRPARSWVRFTSREGSTGPSCNADPRRACCAASCRCLKFFAPLDRLFFFLMPP